MFCWKCGTENPEDARFCKKCGAELNAASAQSSEEEKAKENTAETGVGNMNAAPTSSGEAAGGSKKKLFIGIGIAAAATAVVIALALGLSKGNKPAESGGGTAVANSNTMSANASGSSEVKKDGPKYSGITPQTFDLFAEKTLPNAKAEGMKWDNTLFYWLEDVYTDKDDDGNIASCKIMTTMLKDTGTGDIYRYVVYKDKSNGKIYKIVSMRDTAQGMEVIDYYYKEGVPDFMFVRTESVYTPTYATTDKIGKRYYFNNNVLVRERTVDVPQQIQEKALTREETWYDRVCYFDLPDAEKATYDATEKKVLNMAINTYNAILNSKAIGQVYGTVKNTAGQPVSDTDIRIKQTSGELLYQDKSGSDGTFSFYVYLDDTDCVMEFIPSDTAYKKSTVGSLLLSQSTLLYNIDVILHKAAGDKYAVTLNVIDAEKSLTDENDSYNEKAAGGVEVIFREGYNVRTGATAAEGQSDAAGNVKVDLPPGTYTVEIKGSGFITTYVIIEVEDKAVSEKAYLVSTPASGTTTVLLTWDDSSRDLDLIAFTTEQAEGGDMARIGGGRMKDDMGNILLSENKSGCEVIHLSTAKDGAYRIYVNDFTDSNNGTFSSDSLSRMNLKVYIFCDGNVYVYTFPAGRNGVVWEVAQVNGNTVTSVQQVSNSIEQGSMWTKKWEDDRWKKVYIDAINNNVINDALAEGEIGSSRLGLRGGREWEELVRSNYKSANLEYVLFDVDRDGIPELLAGEGGEDEDNGGKALFTVNKDNEFRVLTHDGNLEHGYGFSELQGIVLSYSGGFFGYSYGVYRLENGELKGVYHSNTVDLDEIERLYDESFRQKYKPLYDLPSYTGKDQIIEAIKAYDSKAQ